MTQAGTALGVLAEAQLPPPPPLPPVCPRVWPYTICMHMRLIMTSLCTFDTALAQMIGHDFHYEHARTCQPLAPACTAVPGLIWCCGASIHCRLAPEYPGEQQQRDKGGHQPQRPVQPAIIAALDERRAGS